MRRSPVWDTNKQLASSSKRTSNFCFNFLSMRKLGALALHAPLTHNNVSKGGKVSGQGWHAKGRRGGEAMGECI